MRRGGRTELGHEFGGEARPDFGADEAELGAAVVDVSRVFDGRFVQFLSCVADELFSVKLRLA